MEELVRDIADELKISEAKAQTAVELVSSYLCRKLPDFMNEQVDIVLTGREVRDVEAREAGLFPLP